MHYFSANKFVRVLQNHLVCVCDELQYPNFKQSFLLLEVHLYKSACLIAVYEFNVDANLSSLEHEVNEFCSVSE